VLAEVSDKIPPAAAFWIFHLVVAALLLGVASLSRRWAALALLLPLGVLWAAFFIHDALVVDDPLREDVVQEMGAGYVLHQAVAALLLAGAVIGGVIVERKS
jgi:hypothetical protein